uniref:Uncharacterized protein n=1 Tax=Tanacetum cinerariifolium TaxID=118510 RepID=A0A6L2JJX0_TANCI|nr:hypothetical protein [Tanacetum cinerariifolium]
MERLIDGKVTLVDDEGKPLTKEYIEGEICFVDMINKEDFKDDILNSLMQNLGYEMDDKVLFYYKIPLKSLDIGLKHLDEEYDSNSESENEIIDEEHVVDEVEIPIKAIQEQMQKRFHVAVSKDKAFREKDKAQVHLRGDVKDPENPTRMFRRIFVCLGALKRGFRECGRELPGLDGAFMRGQFPGQILTAVGVNANNGIYPVAYDRVYCQHLQSCPSAEHRAHCDLLINNVCEVFNRQLLDARDSLIITALEFMREYIMKRTVIVQKVIQKCDGPLTHAVAKLFDKIKAASTRKWEISDILCKHVIAAIHDTTDNGFDVDIPEDSFYDSYKLKKWMNVYSHKVNPFNGRDMWSKFNCPTTLLPPKVHSQIGRPPKKRKKSKGEIVMVKGNKLTRQASQRNESMLKKTTGNKRTSSVIGTRIVAAQVGTQASQAGTQASTGSTFKRTKKFVSRLTPEK